MVEQSTAKLMVFCIQREHQLMVIRRGWCRGHDWGCTKLFMYYNN
jgi:hypothetical protein